MRLAFDISPLVRPYPRGVARATRGLFDALAESKEVELVPVSPDEGENERTWRHGRLPRLLQSLECLGLHSPISAFPHHGPGRRVQTVHELPWHHGARENAGPSHRFWAHFGPWRADAVICPTEFVRRDLLRESSHGQGKIKVCPWGIGSDFATGARDRAACSDLLRKYGLPRAPFALALGATREKKNLAAALRALARADSPEIDSLQLVVTGEATGDLRRDLELAASMGLRPRVHAPGAIDEADLPGLISTASVVLVLSTTEGFGFPALEALACGTPVIVTEGSAQAEVAGEAGICAQPADPSSVSAALSCALQLDDGAREGLRSRAEEFTWRRCAERVEEIWMSWAS